MKARQPGPFARSRCWCSAFIARHYIGVQDDPSAGHQRTSGQGAAGGAGATRSGVRVTAIHQPREQRPGPRLDMAQKNADLQLARLLAKRGSQRRPCACHAGQLA